MSFHLDILTERQRTALSLLAPEAEQRGFYLAGGTAVALHLGHRRSVDFDWFCRDPLPDPLRLAQEIRNAVPRFKAGQISRGTLYGKLSSVQVSFLEYKYPLLDPLVECPEFGCHLAALRDLACMKLSALAQRGAKKDFLDLYALGQQGFRLQEMLDWYRTKFNVQDIAHLAYALAYFDDADRQRTPEMMWKVDWKQVKRTILAWVDEMRA
jgi:hypothetical protein